MPGPMVLANSDFETENDRVVPTRFQMPFADNPEYPRSANNSLYWKAFDSSTIWLRQALLMMSMLTWEEPLKTSER